MDDNGPLSNITSRGGGFANFGGRSDGHGCFPHWALFEGCEGRLVAGVEMKAYVAGESPKTMTVETSDGKKGPWRPVASLSADAAWGEDVPWARVSEPDPAVKHWSWAPMKLCRYLRLTFTSSFNGDAPTMYHTFFYPPVHYRVPPSGTWRGQWQTIGCGRIVDTGGDDLKLAFHENGTITGGATDPRNGSFKVTGKCSRDSDGSCKVEYRYSAPGNGNDGETAHGWLGGGRMETDWKNRHCSGKAQYDYEGGEMPEPESEAEPQAEAWRGEQEPGAETVVEGVIVEMEPERYEMEPER